MAKLIVFLDAGHGLYTAGKRTPDGSLREFQFNDPTAEYVNDLLKNYANVETYFVYDEDGSTDTPLKTRTDRANAIYAKNKGAKAVYVSIHANAYGSGWNSADGIETYVYTTKPAEAVQLANKVQSALIKATGRDNRGVKSANFHVLRETHMTAILVEAGFMTNKEEAKLLKTDEYRRKVAGAIVDGLVAQYGLKRKATPAPTKPAPTKPAPKPQPKGDLYYRVVTGSFTDRKNADERIAKLKKAGFDSFVLPYYKGKEQYFRVITGSFTKRKNAEDRVNALKKKGFDSFLATYYK